MNKEKSENKKKQLIKVEAYGSDPYGSGYTRFSFITHPDEGRKQVGSFLCCRDHMNDSLRNMVHKKEGSTVYSYGNNPPIDMDKLRLLIARNFSNNEDRDKYKNNIFSAKRLLNFYEKIAGWDQSKITTVNHSVFKYNVWLVTGPKEWLSYSHLTSMLTLIFRMIGNHGPIEFSNNEDIERWFCSLMKIYQTEVNSGVYVQDYDLQSYLPSCWDKFYMVMKHNKEIFTQPIEEAYPSGGSFHSWGGFTQLCRFHTSNKTLDRNMKFVYSNFIKAKYANFDRDGVTYKLRKGYIKQKEKERKIKEKERKISENKINDTITKAKSL